MKKSPQEGHHLPAPGCRCEGRVDFPYYVQLKIVSEPVGALHPHQDGVLLLRAEAHGQPVGAGAGALVGGPGERDESAALPEDIGGPGWRREKERERH